MSDGNTSDLASAIKGLHDRITRYVDPLTEALRINPALHAMVQPVWDQAVQPFFQEWNAFWSQPAQWTWVSFSYFTKRWNSVADRVGALLPYALRTRLEHASAVTGHVVGDEASVTEAFTRLGRRIQRYNDLVVQAISADPSRWQDLSVAWEHEVLPFLREWRTVFEHQALWSWSTFNDWATRWSEIASKFTPMLPETVRAQLLPTRVGSVPRGHYRRL